MKPLYQSLLFLLSLLLTNPIFASDVEEFTEEQMMGMVRHQQRYIEEYAARTGRGITSASQMPIEERTKLAQRQLEYAKKEGLLDQSQYEHAMKGVLEAKALETEKRESSNNQLD